MKLNRLVSNCRI